MIGKRIVVFILIISMLVGCTPKKVNESVSFSSFDDIKLQEYVMNELVSGINAEFTNDDYRVEEIRSIFISKEYIDELNYNSRSNIYFGFTNEELDSLFQGKKYVFNVGDNNQTVVEEFKFYEDNYYKIIKNLVIGSGVILFYITASSLTGGTIGFIFAASAKTATQFAVSSSALSGVISTAIEYYNTGDFSEAVEKGLVEGSNSFKWGAIIGGLVGGSTETFNQVRASKQLAKDMKELNVNDIGSRAEVRAYKRYGGREQVSYLNGKEVSLNTKNASRPDLVREVDGFKEAIEVKSYNLNSSFRRKSVVKEITRQVTKRVNDLPSGFKQRIVIDAQGRFYSKSLVDEVIVSIKNACNPVYKDIPVDVSY